MSFCYSFKKSSLSFDNWLEKIDAIVNLDGSGDYQETELSYSVRMRDEGNEPFASKYVVKGSIRGVGVREVDDEIEILINSFASRTDQYLAARLAWEAMAMGATVDKEGHGPIDYEDLNAEELEKAHEEWFKLSKHSANRGSGSISLPVYGFLSLSMTADDVQESEQDLEQKLIDQMTPYGDAYLSNRMSLAVGDSPEGLIASVVLPDTPCLVIKDTQALMIDESLVPIHSFLETAGDQARDGQDSWLLPAINSMTQQQQDAIAAMNMDSETSSAGGDSSHSPDGEATEEEWEQLAEAPAVAFLVIAAADGKIDKKEIEEFGEVLGGLASQGDIPSVSRLMNLAAASFQTIIPELTSGNFDPVEKLLKFRVIVDSKFPEEDAARLKASVLFIAQKVAESSGGFMGLGSKISKKEKKALALVAYALGFGDD
ncbi:MAG: hypothetical protein R3242_04275 [Akkermansiaceae bacterium]|nr:hypothetical protein [Akkermansiaceae bacterium]